MMKYLSAEPLNRRRLETPDGNMRDVCGSRQWQIRVFGLFIKRVGLLIMGLVLSKENTS